MAEALQLGALSTMIRRARLALAYHLVTPRPFHEWDMEATDVVICPCRGPIGPREWVARVDAQRGGRSGSRPQSSSPLVHRIQPSASPLEMFLRQSAHPITLRLDGPEPKCRKRLVPALPPDTEIQEYECTHSPPSHRHLSKSRKIHRKFDGR